MKKQRIEKLLAILAVISVIIAGILGLERETVDLENDISSIIPEGRVAHPGADGRFVLYANSNEDPSGYITIETSHGYGGELISAVRVDTLGSVEEIIVILHRETPSFFEKVIRKGLLEKLEGISYSQAADSDGLPDVITGATYTSEAIFKSARSGAINIAENELGLEVPVVSESGYKAGIPEIALVLLYIIALAGVYTRFRYKKLLRWFTLIAGLVILGFWFSVPLTLPRINLFLMGFWPDWHENLYWYILVFGFFLTLLVTRKNIYCSWICPLGCIQDGLGLVGAARPRFSKKVNFILTWIQRGVAWLAIILALYFRNPVEVNYEIFGVSLSLTGASYLFAMTGIFFIASVFIKRPWCNYLCPITPVSDLVRSLSLRTSSSTPA